nr:hypothetical protein [Streptomyces leeuwenhoekii]
MGEEVAEEGEVGGGVGLVGGGGGVGGVGEEDFGGGFGEDDEVVAFGGDAAFDVVGEVGDAVVGEEAVGAAAFAALGGDVAGGPGDVGFGEGDEAFGVGFVVGVWWVYWVMVVRWRKVRA